MSDNELIAKLQKQACDLRIMEHLDPYADTCDDAALRLAKFQEELTEANRQAALYAKDVQNVMAQRDEARNEMLRNGESAARKIDQIMAVADALAEELEKIPVVRLISPAVAAYRKLKGEA